MAASAAEPISDAPLSSKLGPRETAAGSFTGQVQSVLGFLGKSLTGSTLLKRAKSKWGLNSPEELNVLFKPGPVSRTDAVLTRHLDPSTGVEKQERHVTIFLKEGSATEDLVLDLAHELVHALTDPSWDPYDPKLTVSKYIWYALEAEGGEIEALLSECQVALELAVFLGLPASRCEKYRLAPGAASLSREKIRADFYRVGKWQEQVSQRLAADASLFPMLSSDRPALYSSTGRAPYPVALIREFDEMTQIACENSKKRLDHMLEGRSPAGRSPSSASDQSPQAIAERSARTLIALRCQASPVEMQPTFSPSPAVK